MVIKVMVDGATEVPVGDINTGTRSNKVFIFKSSYLGKFLSQLSKLVSNDLGDKIFKT